MSPRYVSLRRFPLRLSTHPSSIHCPTLHLLLKILPCPFCAESHSGSTGEKRSQVQAVMDWMSNARRHRHRFHLGVFWHNQPPFFLSC
jgi:hypothetical protein